MSLLEMHFLLNALTWERGEIQNNVMVNMQNEIANPSMYCIQLQCFGLYGLLKKENISNLVAVNYVIYWLSYNCTTYLMLRKPEILKSTQHSNNSNHSIRELCVRWWKKVTQNVSCLTKLLLLPMGISNFCLLSRTQSYCYYVSGVMRRMLCVFSFLQRYVLLILTHDWVHLCYIRNN